ncbi:helix-turn-helix domain-containing protein [Clostridium sp. Marseille-Q7071]
MERKQTQVATLHNHTLENLIKLEQEHTSKYSRRALRAVIMSYQGIHLDDIERILNVSRVTLLTYIKSWNKNGLDSIEDGRGGSESSFTNEMLDEIRMILTTKDPREFGFISSVWSIDRVREYVDKKFGRLYSYERTRQIMIELGFSYKRGEYHPTLADPQKQIAFKKNAQDTPYCRKLF